MKSPLVYFRADANCILGSGHIMRCLSIAAALRAQGRDCVFLTADQNADGLLNGKAVGHCCLNSRWDDLEAELPQMERLLMEQKPDLLVVDHYYVTERYLASLRKHTCVIYLDDLRSFRYPCDLLINYNAYALDWENDYRSQYADTSTKLLLGPQYAPLREEFQHLPPKEIRESVRDVLISTGGADPANVAGVMLEMIAGESSWKSITFHFVVGALNPNLPAMERAAAALPNVCLHQNVHRMSLLMQACDVAVAAAGSTLYELCACGVPTITYVLADNQIPGAEGFARRGIMLSAGDCRMGKEFPAMVKRCLQALLVSQTRRKELSAVMQASIDGTGAERIAQALLSLGSSG